jgi:hypothetical protein
VDLGNGSVVHIEFQSSGERQFGIRMLEYWLRLHHRPDVKGRELVQHVLMLGEGTVEDGVRGTGLGFHYRVLICTSRVLPLRGMVALREL